MSRHNLLLVRRLSRHNHLAFQIHQIPRILRYRIHRHHIRRREAHEAAGDRPQLFADGLHVVPHHDGTVAVGSTAERDFAAPDTTDDRLEFLAQKLLSRSFRPEEKNIIIGSLAELEAFYNKNEADAKKLITVGESKPDEKLSATTLAAWTMVCNELMNLDEVLNK